MKPIQFSQEEANHLLMALVAREDLLDRNIQEAGKRKDTGRIIEIAKIKETLKKAEEKLCEAGAQLP